MTWTWTVVGCWWWKLKRGFDLIWFDLPLDQVKGSCRESIGVKWNRFNPEKKEREIYELIRALFDDQKSKTEKKRKKRDDL